MKKLSWMAPLFSILLLSVLDAAQTITPNLGYTLPSPGAANWGYTINSNFSLTDRIFSSGTCGDPTHAVSYNATTKTFGCQLLAGTGNLSFSDLTSGTNTTSLLMGTGGSLGVTGTGVIDSTSLLGNTWAIPGTIGSTTPSTGVFTTLTSGTLNISGLTGSVQCLHVNSAGLVSGTGIDCGSGGGGGVSSVSGTANQILVADGSTTPTLSISPTFTFPGTVTNGLSIFTGTSTSSQFLGLISDETGSGLVMGNNSPTILTPTIASFANAQHDHTSAAQGGVLSLISGAFSNQGSTVTVLHGNASGNVSFGSVVNNDIANATIDLTAKVTNTLPVANGGTGTTTPGLVAGTGITLTGSAWPNQTINAVNVGTVTHTAGALTTSALMVGNGTADSKVLASLGTSTTVLHGNAAGLPTFGAVQIADMGASGSPSSATYLRGDNTWATPTGSGTVTTTGSPVSAQVAVLSGTTSITGDATYTFNSTTKNVQAQGMITGATPALDPRSTLFGSCKGDGTDTSAAATACWQSAEAYMQAHGGSILCAAGTTWTLNRVLINSGDTFQGTTWMGPGLGCKIFVSVDAAFVPATVATSNYVSDVTFRNMYFSGGVNPIDIPYGNEDTFQNLQFRDPTGCGISFVDGERQIFDNVSGGWLAQNGTAVLCTGAPTWSLFSSTVTSQKPTSSGLARSSFVHIFAGGASPSHYSQYLWVNGDGTSQNGNLGEAFIQDVGCFFNCSLGILKLGTTNGALASGVNVVIDDIWDDSIASGLSAAPVAFNFIGEWDALRISGSDLGNSAGNETTQMQIQTCTACALTNVWFSNGVNNTSTFGLKITSTFGGALVGVRGGVWANAPAGITAIGSYNLNPSNLKGGNGSFAPQLADNGNTDMYFDLCGNVGCTTAATSTFHFWRNTGSAGAGSDDFALSTTGALFKNPLELTEHAAPTGASGFDWLWGDSTAHRLKMNNNNGGAFYVPGISVAGTSGNCVKLAANGIDIVDNGSACGSGGSSSWNGITNPTGNQTLTMTGDSTTWNWGATNTNQFAIDTSGNPTWGLVSATTAITNSPTWKILGSYQNAGTPTYAADSWSLQNVVGSGTNGSSILTLSHSGSTGAGSGLGVPYFKVPSMEVGTATLGSNVNFAAGDLDVARSGGAGAIWFGDAAESLQVGFNGVDVTRFSFGSSVSVPSASEYAFTSGAVNNNSDTGLSRASAGVVDVGNGTAADTSGTLKLSRIQSGSLAPTCTFTSGGGTTPSCAVDTGSSDSAGIIKATTGTGSPAGTGTITLTFSSGAAFGTNKPTCIYMASDAGAGAWNGLAVMKDLTPSTTSDVFTWTDGTVPTGLTASTAYWINYHCWAK